MPITETLKFLCTTLDKCHIRNLIFDTNVIEQQELDNGIRKLLGAQNGLGKYIKDNFLPIEQRTVYTFTDKFNNSYIFLKLPDDSNNLLLFVGPFHSTVLNREQILVLIEKLNIPPNLTSEIEKYYNTVPYLPIESHIYIMLDVFYEKIWGRTKNYKIKELRESYSEENDWSTNPTLLTPEVLSWKVKAMEERYRHENRLMTAIANGDIDRVKSMMPMFSALSFEQRLTDNLRNIQNHIVIMNTILRKAAENGGVHPVHLDKISSKYATRIENLRSVGQAGSLMQEMLTGYCKLVKKHSTSSYSLPVQRAITVIEYDISAELTLAEIAKLQGINASYLSTIFKKETGETLTGYVNSRRIEMAMKLLETTRLQVQTIAQHCGILDVHYFSRMFKKHTGVTPQMYRNTLQK